MFSFTTNKYFFFDIKNGSICKEMAKLHHHIATVAQNMDLLCIIIVYIMLSYQEMPLNLTDWTFKMACQQILTKIFKFHLNIISADF